MTEESEHHAASELLRHRAEEIHRRSPPEAGEDIKQLPTEEIRRRFHELRVHQIELEMQNLQLRQAQSALEASQARYFDLYDMAPVGYCTVGEEGLFRETNLMAANLLGLARGELTGKRFSQFVHPGESDAYYLLIRRLFTTLEPQSGELRMVRLDGSPFWVHLSARPAEDDRGGLVSRIVLSDITERKLAENELKALQAQLLQAQKMEAIGTLAGGIAHDFNNILGAILGNAELIELDSPPGSEVRNRIQQVLKAGQRARDLVKQILAISHQTEVEKFAILPAQIVDESVKLLQASLPTSIAIQQDIDFVAGPIFADPTQIHQIVMNLCTNAYHAMENTGGTLAISLKTVTVGHGDIAGLQPGKYVRLTIGDTGPGIAPEIEGKIFDPYFTTKEIGKGTGLGLAIIHGLVKGYGGSISYQTRLGEGTVFAVHFPTIDDSTTLAEVQEEQPRRGDEHILLIDDEDILARLYQTMLERLGYRVTIATSSLEALAIFQKHPHAFALVFADHTMPGVTGRELPQRILEIRPDLPIILSTDYRNQLTEERIRSSGIKGIALKPLSQIGIAALVRTVLDGQPSPWPPQTSP